MKKIMLINPKGGCGKSNICTNLAGYYTSLNYKVGLVDMDNQKSSLHWLRNRPEKCNPITQVPSRDIASIDPQGFDYLFIDTPANINFQQISSLIKIADILLIPVLPSPTDIHASGHFIYQLLLKHKVTYEDKPVGVIANRSRPNTMVYRELVKFLNDIQFPFIATLRDSRNYLQCAGEGTSIFEYKNNTMLKDIENWKPLISWLNKKLDKKNNRHKPIH